MVFDKKEKVILQHYIDSFLNFSFDEFDVLGFLIFIRRHLNVVDHAYVREFADLVAHRERTKGKAMKSIASAIDNNYATEKNSKAVLGYCGVEENEWKKEWQNLFDMISISFSDRLIKEISICIFSLAQFTKYKDKNNHSGEIQLLIDCNNNLLLCTIDRERNSKCICFAKCGPFDFEKGFIDKEVVTYRENGILHLKMIDGTILL